MLNTKSVFLVLGAIVILIGMMTGYTPSQMLCDHGAPWCNSTRI